MKRLILLLLLCFISIEAQTIQLFWDLDGDKQADLTFNCSDGDTITAKLYIANTDTSSIVAGYPISTFSIPVLYGYYTRWSSISYHSNILALDTMYVDSAAVADSTGAFTILHNETLRRFQFDYEDSTGTAIESDTCLATFTFIVNGTGMQILHIAYQGEEDNYNMTYNIVVLNERKFNYSLWVRNCIIISE